jgi:cellulose biosynthesis protein BcsQ
MPSDRYSAKRLAIFNHKGGVGKTTLTYNIAAALANLDKRVLLVDSDPQCNLTSYLLPEDVLDDLLDSSDTDKGATIWSALAPIAEATGDIRPIKPQILPVANVFLIPGDIRLSEFESELNEFWAQSLQRKSKGFRGTTALSQLVNRAAHRLEVDYVFYDCGPNIGPLNRVILLDCDYFIIPAACDLFSVRALKTLGRTLGGWVREWKTISDLAPTDTYDLPGKPQFLGYIPQNFRVYGGQPAAQHLRYLTRIEKSVQADIVTALRRVAPELVPSTSSQFKLGEVKNFASLVPASHTYGLPLAQVQTGTPQQREAAGSVFESIAKKIVQRTESQSASA